MAELPSASSPNLILDHPTSHERSQTWTLNAKSWGGALSLPDYLEREEYLMNIPATRDGGVTRKFKLIFSAQHPVVLPRKSSSRLKTFLPLHYPAKPRQGTKKLTLFTTDWILTDSSLPADSRPLLSSCESLRRRALLAHPSDTIEESITHGIGSVFCPPAYRGRGYASRMLTLVGSALKSWQKEVGTCHFSILYSDIGKKYYTGLGWDVFPSSHVYLPPAAFASPAAATNRNGTNGTHRSAAKELYDGDLEELCKLDEEYVKALTLKTAKKTNKPAVALLPDHQTMQWHHLREAFVCSKLFPSRAPPAIRGAISSGEVGSRVWIIFTRVFYGPIGKVESGNTLYILRLVVEDESDTEENAKKLKGVLSIAQREAKEWRSNGVSVWNVNEDIKKLLRRADVQHDEIDREEDSICQLRWYGEGEGGVENLEWVVCEKFGWC
ncbi:hypothetical protein G7Y89_g6020 [Cudoniella acicularis]|uniref:LYC1 C-terminal domain-containing protein n=1 Tax=Cudoniella acicularis TaxID=354080 RepID=A0A8H4RNQ2_9HELO|nr:hypothetical protein G7Y89_g6020 [Cudoniella acicularis]